MDRGQTKLWTAIESFSSVALGVAISFGLSHFAGTHQEFIRTYVYSGFEWTESVNSTLLMVGGFTTLSIIRSYIWRRLFNHLHVRRVLDEKRSKS